MKRSAINQAFRDASACFTRHGWSLPPKPKWDITDFGLGDFSRIGLVLVNLADEPQYCEKLMFARRGQATPCHAHARKKEDIICRSGELTLRLWPMKPSPGASLPGTFPGRIDGAAAEIPTGSDVVLPAGSRVTIEPGIWHSFWPGSAECIIGEVSTKNDDIGDNFFLDLGVGRFSPVEEDAKPEVRLITD